MLNKINTMYDTIVSSPEWKLMGIVVQIARDSDWKVAAGKMKVEDKWKIDDILMSLCCDGSMKEADFEWMKQFNKHFKDIADELIK